MAKALTLLTRPDRIVERKQVRGRLDKCHAIAFESIGKRVLLYDSIFNSHNFAFSFAFEKSGFNGIHDPSLKFVIFTFYDEAIDQEHPRIGGVGQDAVLLV